MLTPRGKKPWLRDLVVPRPFRGKPGRIKGSDQPIQFRRSLGIVRICPSPFVLQPRGCFSFESSDDFSVFFVLSSTKLEFQEAAFLTRRLLGAQVRVSIGEYHEGDPLVHVGLRSVLVLFQSPKEVLLVFPPLD